MVFFTSYRSRTSPMWDLQDQLVKTHIHDGSGIQIRMAHMLPSLFVKFVRIKENSDIALFDIW